MPNLVHWMVDIETLSTKPNAVITQLAAAAFTIDGVVVESEFSAVVEDWDDQVKLGRDIDANTVKWWLQQSKEAQDALFSKPAYALRHALSALATHMRLYNAVDDYACSPVVWGNGATFDNVVLASAYDTYGLRRPWSYKHDRCARTMLALPAVVDEPARAGVHHNAVDDVMHQIRIMTMRMRQAGFTELF